MNDQSAFTSFTQNVPPRTPMVNQQQGQMMNELPGEEKKDPSMTPLLLAAGFFILLYIIVAGLAYTNMFQFGDDFEYVNPEGETKEYPHGAFEMDTPDPQISGIYCKLMDVLCATTEEEASALGRDSLPPIC